MSAVDPASDPTVAVAIDHTRSDWTCTACGQSLGALALNRRSCAHLVELPVVAALQTAGQLIRPSGPETAIVQREFVCPGCGSMLSVDGAVQQDPTTRAVSSPLQLTFSNGDDFHHLTFNVRRRRRLVPLLSGLAVPARQ
jgi:acetone carboxylase gamma subunit